jgi:uncharacterized Ntn-hydrolase superfamily protein
MVPTESTWRRKKGLVCTRHPVPGSYEVVPITRASEVRGMLQSALHQDCPMPINRMCLFFRRALSTLLACGMVGSPGLATWSIVVMDMNTREVVVAGATCLPDFDIASGIAVIAVGKGGGVSQATLLGQAKGIIFSGLQAAKSPERIMEDIFATNLSMPDRQFGIVGLEGPAASFTGSQTLATALGLSGQIGNLRYAIQGNILAQSPVIHQALATLSNSQGDLGQRVMLAMETATALGGDGRCSCPGGMTPCGQPQDFRRASFTAFMIVARQGDTDSATCGVTNFTCSNGNYYAKIRKMAGPNDPDPILLLRRKYNRWRQQLSGRADHYNTEVLQTAQVIKADGLDSSTVDISLVDVDGLPLVSGGQNVLVTLVDGPPLSISPVSDNGDGTHHFSVTAGMLAGDARLRIVIQDGIRDVQLFPDLEIQLATPTELFTDQNTVSSSAGALVEFIVDSPANAGRPYHLLGSASGTNPGTPFGGLILPLNRDGLLSFTLNNANGPQLPASMGVLDGSGAASAFLQAPPGFLASWSGRHLDFVIFQTPSGAAPSRVSNLVGFDVAP